MVVILTKDSFSKEKGGIDCDFDREGAELSLSVIQIELVASYITIHIRP